MHDFEDSTLWRISSYERMRVERSSSVFAQLGENTVLPTTLLADLRHLESRREDSDVIEVLAACMRHRQGALPDAQLAAFRRQIQNRQHAQRSRHAAPHRRQSGLR